MLEKEEGCTQEAHGHIQVSLFLSLTTLFYSSLGKIKMLGKEESRTEEVHGTYRSVFLYLYVYLTHTLTTIPFSHSLFLSFTISLSLSSTFILSFLQCNFICSITFNIFRLGNE